MRQKKNYMILTFKTTTAAMAMEKKCSEEGIPGRLIPLPGEISAGCAVSRTFYVGDALKPDDVKAKYEDGVLVVSLSKKAPEAIEQRSQIAIEG